MRYENLFVLQGTHDLRRTFATKSKMGGLSEDIIQKIGGWEDKKTLQKHHINLPDSYVREEYFKIKYLPK